MYECYTYLLALGKQFGMVWGTDLEIEIPDLVRSVLVNILCDFGQMTQLVFFKMNEFCCILLHAFLP